MRLLRLIFLCETLLFTLWMIIEGVYSSTIIASLVAIFALLFLTIFIPKQTIYDNRITRVLLVIADIMAISYFVMELSFLIDQTKGGTVLPFSYNRLTYIGYSLFYLTLIIAFLTVFGFLVSTIFKKKHN